MEPTTIDALLAAALTVAVLTAAAYRRKLEAARAELAAERGRLAASPPRIFESRQERYGLLWFSTLTLDDDRKLVVTAAAGLPHCARCVRPLKLSARSENAPEEWTCGTCDERRPGSTADLMVTDAVVSDTIQEFLTRRDGWRAVPSLSRKPQFSR